MFRELRDGPLHMRHHHGFQPLLLDGVFQLFDAFLRRVHGDHRHRCHAIRILAINIRVESIEGAASYPADFFIFEAGRSDQVVG